MAERVLPVAQVRLYEPGQEFQAKYDGFAQRDIVAELFAEGKVAVNTVDRRASGLPQPGDYRAQITAAMALSDPRLNCVVARPFLDTSQAIGQGHFTLVGGYWTALEGLGLEREVKLYQYDGRPGQTTGAISKFTLPADPVICLSLYRAEPGPEQDWEASPPYTEIHFGISERDEWALALPYGSPMFLLRRYGDKWQKVQESEHSVVVPTLEGFAKGQRMLLWLAVWRQKLVISTDGFASDMWIYELPGEAVRIPRGKISLWHNAGQWMFSVIPIKMVPAVLMSEPIEAGYDTHDSSGELILNYRHRPVVSDEGIVLAECEVTDDTSERAELAVTQRSWKAVISPYTHYEPDVGTDPETGESVSFSTDVSPELYSVQIGQFAEVEAVGPVEYADASETVKLVTGDHPQHLHGVAYDLRLDNQDGRYAGLREYQRIEVELGWQMSDNSTITTPVFSGYVVEPVAYVESGGRSEVELSSLDGVIRLRDEKCDGRVPAFDNWPVKTAFEWVLDRCGIPRGAQDLEDTGARLSAGEPEEPLWLPEPGRSWLEFLEEMAQYDYGAVIYFDAEGRFRKVCPYCRQKRTPQDVLQHDGTAEGACSSDIAWELYTRSGSASNADEEGEILAIAKPRLSLSSRDYANYVCVCGVGRDGRPLRSTVYDAASLYDNTADRYIGWRKMEVRALRTATTQAELNRLAQSLFTDLSRKPEYIHIVTPLCAGMRIGQVIKVHGAESVGGGGQLYRISAVSHELIRRRGRIATTSVTARWLGEAEN